jgi:hypothetical protein
MTTATFDRSIATSTGRHVSVIVDIALLRFVAKIQTAALAVPAQVSDTLDFEQL